MHLLPRALGWFTAHSALVLVVWIASAVLIERLVRKFRGTHSDDGAATSVSAGVAYIVAKGVVSKVLMFGVAMWVYEHRLFQLDAFSPLVWLGVFVARDFVYYWIHRAEHRVSALWASHMIHHSSERFTFTTAVRMPWMEALYKPLLGLWVPLLGFHPVAFAALGALVLMIGQLQHTELMQRRTRLDGWFVTPSVHRVHHGSNTEYIDKNFGSMLAIWDRVFGTYQPETVAVRYGLTGSYAIERPGQALIGGYPQLWARFAATKGATNRLRVLTAAPA
jgi:sterol desaturase/sphingolipid hydroxylase (fatty acid hydroxylase superfamily)